MAKQKTLGKNVALSSIFLNLVIFLVKGIIALNIGSLALLSDSVHSFSDSASSLAVYFGLKISEKPADETHPFGHGRAEHVALLAVGIILLITALKFLTDGITSLLTDPQIVKMSRMFYIVIFSTAVAKEIMAEVSYYVGKKEGSESLKGDAWHHRSDAITTIVVIAGIYGSELGYSILDPLVGIGIAVLLGYIGFNYARDSTYDLLGKAPSDKLVKDIKKKGRNVEGVEDVHDIKVHDYGETKAISLHMESTPGTLKDSHRTAHQLESILQDEFDSYVEVHIDPWRPPETEIKGKVKSVVESKEMVLEAHRIEIAEKEECILVSFHLVIPGAESIQEGHEMATKIENELIDELEDMMKAAVDIQVHLEPDGSEME